MSKIEWTDRTWNTVTGCTKVSPGCDNCYMYRSYSRLRVLGNPGYQATPDTVTLMEGRLEEPLKWTKRSRVFVCSMSDLFHVDVPHEYLDRMFEVMTQAAEKRGHTFQVLTKRPGRALSWWDRHRKWQPPGGAWPEAVHLGTSVEDQNAAHRLDVLERIPAPLRFVSAEPLLGPLEISPWLERGAVQWVIVGGESGPEARPMELQWARDLQRQCEQNGVAYFLKQLGGRTDKRSGEKALLDGRRWTEFPE